VVPPPHGRIPAVVLKLGTAVLPATDMVAVFAQPVPSSVIVTV
jgi:hypothetical protein